MQRKFFNGVICGAFIALALLALRSHQIERDQAAALQNLQRKTAALEKQLAAAQNPATAPLDLQQQTREDRLRGVQPNMDSIPNGIITPFGAQLPEPTVPPGWRPFKFNGETHYWVPLANAPADSALAVR